MFSIVMNFEAFGSSPDFTTPVQEFLFKNAPKFELTNGEQSLGNYQIFKDYSEMLDKTLQKFLDYGKLDAEVFIAAMQFARQENLPCSFLDYVLSSIDYEDFVSLMADYKKIGGQEIKSGENDDFIDKELEKDEENVRKKKKKEIRKNKK